MEPAHTVIKQFGGAPAIADLLGLPRKYPYRWEWPRERGGTGGRIPQKHHATILRLARERGLNHITAELLVAGPVASEAAE